MRRARKTIGLVALSSACGGAVLAPPTSGVRATCRVADVPVLWTPVAPGERPAHDAWCAAVGVPLLLQPARQPARSDSLLVVTWNVKVGGGDVAAMIADLRRGALTGGAPIEHFVLLLQETHRAGGVVPDRGPGMRVPRGIIARTPDGHRTAIDVVAREHGLALAYVPSMRNGDRPEDRGNAILATLPLRDIAAIELPIVRQRRVAVAATVAASTRAGAPWNLQLVSTHLENRPSRGLTGTRERAKQMARLLDALPTASHSVLGGDLNTWVCGEEEPTVALALQRYPQTGPTVHDVTFDGPAFFNVRLDYLFARLPGGRLAGYTRVGRRYGSDHHPVLAWVKPAAN
jgi:endonuclease/exonuclease/phosphatase family metal-dependent hydrolase